MYNLFPAPNFHETVFRSHRDGFLVFHPRLRISFASSSNPARLLLMWCVFLEIQSLFLLLSSGTFAAFFCLPLLAGQNNVPLSPSFQTLFQRALQLVSLGGPFLYFMPSPPFLQHFLYFFLEFHGCQLGEHPSWAFPKQVACRLLVCLESHPPDRGVNASGS